MNSDIPGSRGNNNGPNGWKVLNNAFSGLCIRLDWKKSPCVFTLSTGRSGTLTLIKMLGLSPDIYAVHEPDPKLLDEFNTAFYEIRANSRRYRTLFKDARRDIICQARRQRKIYAEGAIMKYFSPVIAAMMKNARFLYCHRHPAGVVRSGMRRGWYQGHVFDKYKLAPIQTDPAYDKWQEWDAFAKNCWMWKMENEFFLRFINHVGDGRALKVPFEKLIDPESNFSQDLFRFIGVDPPGYDEVCGTLKVQHNKQQTGDFPEFNQWSDAQKRTLYDIAGDVMQELGYQ